MSGPLVAAQRPDDVLNEETYESGSRLFPQDLADGTLTEELTDRIRWDRGVGDRLLLPPNPEGERQPLPGDNDMVAKWSRMGFVVPKTTSAGEVFYLETGRSRFDGLKDREYFYYLLNLDSYPEFLPKARALAEEFLQGAENLLNDPKSMEGYDMYLPFEYTSKTLAQRLNDIYSFYQSEAAKDPLDDPNNIFRSREDLVERIRQFAAFNQMDGA